MKFLEISSFQTLSTLLSSIKSADLIIHGHLEAYSCKRAGGDKKLYRSLDRQYSSGESSQPERSDMIRHDSLDNGTTPVSLLADSFDEDPEFLPSPNSLSLSLSLSSPSHTLSPFGSLIESSSRHTFISLISTLNASFPDYDFSSLKPEEFTKEHLSHASTRINNLLLTCLTDSTVSSEFVGKFWHSLDNEIHLKESDVFSYIPEADINPFADDDEEPCLWMYNYFFYNKKLKRIVFFHLRAGRNQKFHSSYRQDPDEMDLFD